MGSTELLNWLNDRQRSYADGLAIFINLATDQQKKRFLPFLSEVTDVPEFDSHFTVLKNKLQMIASLCGVQQIVVDSKAPEPLIKIPEMKKETVEDTMMIPDIILLQKDLEELKERLDNNDDNASDMLSHIVDIENRIEEEKEKYSGTKIITYEELSPNLKTAFDRVRTITPEYASLFTEMQNESLTSEERLSIAQRAYDLWKERQNLWNLIDGKSDVKEEVSEVTENVDTPDLIKGVQYANRIERLKENIRRTEVSIEHHEQAGKKNLKFAAEERLKRYKQELKDLMELTQ